MEIVPLNVRRVAEGWKPVIGRAGGASGSSMIGPVNEYKLFICALGVVINDFADHDEVVAGVLRDQKRNGDTFDIKRRIGVR